MAICAQCQQEIPERQEVVVLDKSQDDLRLFFLCPQHAKEMDDAGLIKDITSKVKG